MPTKMRSRTRNTPNDVVPIRRALISVSDKSGLDDLVPVLNRFGVEIVSTGATASAIRQTGAEAREVSDLTGQPEIMDGRVKTLHPGVHGGLLADPGNSTHVKAMAEHGIESVQLLIVNLYPFESTVAGGADPEFCIENIDIGGPAMIRAAAKNHAHVCAIADVADYRKLIDEMELTGGGTRLAFRREMAEIAFSGTASYDAAVADWMALRTGVTTPRRRRTVVGHFVRTLRYGENPHQGATLYSDGSGRPGPVSARQLQGKELSYNNYCDLDAGLGLISEFCLDVDGAACVIVKHGNPCGVACRSTVLDAYLAALDCDPDSAFGGIVCFNSRLTQDVAKAISSVFTEVVSAPSFDHHAAKTLETRTNLRLLEVDPISDHLRPRELVRPIVGGFLLQDSGGDSPGLDTVTTVTERHPSDDEVRDMLFGWRVVRHVTSNAVVYCRDRKTAGIGAGQMSRVDSARIAGWKARDKSSTAEDGGSGRGLVAASDAFLPFPDAISQMTAAGVTALIQPGGSRNDSEVIQAANDAGVAMVFTGIRQFSH